jgi:hypothetical protein
MNHFAITALLVGTVSVTALAANIDGKWISEMQVGDADGKTYILTSTFVLKSDGTLLTGTVVQTSEAPWAKSLNGKTFEISDGKIEESKFSFKVTVETKTGERTAIYDGSIDGNQLTGTIKKYRGIGITRPFAAKRGD